MKLEKLQIKSFGPLKDRDYIFSDGLNLFFGPNESGKTSIVDLIIKELFRSSGRQGTKSSSVFKGTERYRDEEFSGEITFLEGKDRYSLPNDRKRLNLEKSIGDLHLSRLVCVESGDLSLPAEEGFFEKIREKLSGSTGNIEAIKRAIFEKAALPQSGEISKGSKFYAEMEETSGKLENLKELSERLSEIQNLKKEIADVKGEIDRTASLRLRSAGSEFRKYLELSEKAKGFKNFTSDEFKRLRKLKELKDNLQTKKSAEDRALEEATKWIVEEEGQLQEKRALIREAGARLSSTIFFEFEEGIKECFTLERRIKTSVSHKKPLRQAFPFLFAFAAILLIAALFSGKGAVLYFLSVIFTLSGALSYKFHLGARAAEERLDKLKRRLKVQSEELQVPYTEDPSEMALRIDGEKGMRKKFEGEVEALERSLKKRKEAIPAKDEEYRKTADEIEMTGRRLEKLFAEFEVGSVEEYEKKLSELNGLQNGISSMKKSLRILLGEDESLWEGKIAAISKELDSDESYSPELFEELSERLTSLNNKLKALEEPFIREGITPPQNVLTKIAELEESLGNKELERDAVTVCREIIDEISKERNGLLAKIISDKSGPLAGKIARIVGKNRAEGISTMDGELSMRMDGRPFSPSHLSRGTHDQVMLAFRLAVIEELAGEPMFLILDDVLLTSDADRKKAVSDILKESVKSGWQILYFTCDSETKGILGKTFKDHKLFELKPLY